MNKMIFAALIFVVAFSASAQTPLPTVNNNVTTESIKVAAYPEIVTTHQMGETASVQFRARFDGSGVTTSNFRTVPVNFAAHDNEGRDISADTLKCQLEVGICNIRSDIPRVVVLTAYLNNAFGLKQVVLNFATMRGSLPARIDVTASETQAAQGTITTLVATSPIATTAPVTVSYSTSYSNPADSVQGNMYFPDGLAYGQRIPINFSYVFPLSFQEGKYFQVQFYSNGNLIAQGMGSSVGTSESKMLDAEITQSGDLLVTLSGPFNAATDYSVVLLRGEKFRVELSTTRAELLVYQEGNNTKILFNRGSLGPNKFLLPGGYYTVSVQALDRTNSNYFAFARADALAIRSQHTLR